MTQNNPTVVGVAALEMSKIGKVWSTVPMPQLLQEYNPLICILSGMSVKSPQVDPGGILLSL